MRRLALLFFTLAVMITTSVQADHAFTQRKDVQNFIHQMVKNYGFNKNDLTTLFSQVQIQPKIIESMDQPYEKKTWDVYKNIFLTDERLQNGYIFWKENQKALERAEKEYQVPAHIIVAVLGVETLYGKKQGNYRVIDALSTLAFEYPKRSDFFTKELREYLLLCRENKINPVSYYGSYAGAIGQPQFMPSSYRTFAVDFSGQGKKDLINNNSDVIGSVANYFHQHGWTMNEAVAQPAKIKEDQISKITVNTKKANYSIKKLLKNGVQPETGSLNIPKHVGLIEMITDDGKEYWLAYPNFYVITRYNTSPQYALAVYLLSQQLKKQWALAKANGRHAYA